ncbi:hypothetical protein MN032_15665 [Agromyces atrinae]|uniref:hypothetical protein n=1 Tax=Agromyces atrinae TaxID=592376 RepID=UPI001F58B015|nr:hypothetical protein [Agromyces atrinae]MCI2959128.1 hypothetical protein [Agromyces atrinae]
MIEGTSITIGTQFIDGEIYIAGLLSGDGLIDWNGTMRLRGPATIEDGGAVTVLGGISVRLGLTDAGVPGLQFGTGGQVVGTSDGVQLNNASGNGFAYANADRVGMSRGPRSINVDVDRTSVVGPFRLGSLTTPPPGTAVYDVVTDGAGNIFRRP